MRYLFLVAAIGAVLGAAVGWFLQFPGAWWYWVGGGASAAVVLAAVVLVIMIAEDGIAIPAVLLAVAAAGLLAPSPARADAIAKHGNDWVRIMALACSNDAVRAAITMHGEDPDQFFAAAAHLHGQEFQACWRPIGGGAYVVYDDGDQGQIPTAALKTVPEA